MEEEDEPEFDLDMKWIEEFEKIDSTYQSFYTEKIKHVKFSFVYISKDDDIEKITEETILLENENCISKEEIIKILKQRMNYMEKRYTVLSILKYNIDIEPADVSFYLKN